ncbi:DUF3710 domain-containing protein [Corynebacterium sp. p3-SID1145]|uniref:DUF3710 domain-containing protein n=1 Tax=unclassified Corynebacterium TaxID=2624378 RepID=UPI0021AA51E9|nr:MULTISPECIES: DUF3710 domain-containing protein [unclassified Corynebacterium]MCT1452284.1 DUF3710 domain-containing protein [Corynebacterium sp. p3-SID1145]MCT1461320.1 DUF3710 domain-containing protein [Corynebacterium sp. p3-SID1140]
MGLWPFGKKKKQQDAEPVSATDSQDADNVTYEAAPEQEPATPAGTAEPAAEPVREAAVADTEADASAAAEIGETAPATTESTYTGPVTIEHDAVGGDTGPFDGDNVDIKDFDFSDFAEGILNLGSIQLPLPKGSQVQVEMGEQGPRMLHVVTEFGRVTPVAFAAPNSGGMWEESSDEIIEGMRGEGMPAEFEKGPWGREVVGRGANGVIRIVGVEGPRWLYRVTLAAPHGKEDQLAELAHEIIARSFIYRGTAPVLAGNSLPVELPAQLAAQLQQAMAQQQQQQNQGQGQDQNQNPEN